jgi:DNA-binding NarL/FixJ family response regulator
MTGLRLRMTTVVGMSFLTETCVIVFRPRGEDRLIDERPTVVFADDNLKVTEIACALLSADYDVVKVAIDGEEAVRWICELKPDFAVMDISMPKMNGIAVAGELRRAGLRTRIIFVTVIEDEDYIKAARSIGHGYVLKRRLSLDLLTALAAARNNSFFCSQ